MAAVGVGGLDQRRVPAMPEGEQAMNYPPQLSSAERRQVCEDLLLILQADQLEELAALRLRMLRESRDRNTPGFLSVRLGADRIAKVASRFVHGPADEWLDAAAALERPSEVDVCIEAIRQFAEQIRLGWEPPQPETQPEQRQKQPQEQEQLSVRVRIHPRRRGSRK